MKKYILERQTILKSTLNEAWRFFSNPANLNYITPPEMKLNVISRGLPEKIHSGLNIQYTVQPLFGIRLNWTTEIKDVNEPFYFADDQIKGPYALWHHEHSFEEINDGVLMKDKVTYAIPFGIIGRLAHFTVVRSKLQQIFTFRENAIRKFFPG